MTETVLEKAQELLSGAEGDLNQKGEIGKTTVAVNLLHASALERVNDRIFIGTSWEKSALGVGFSISSFNRIDKC